MEAAQVNTVPCCRCKEENEKVIKKQSGAGASTHAQIIWALNSRINRMLKWLTYEQSEGYTDMSTETRQDFVKKAAGLRGPELKKVLEETINWSIEHQRTQSMKYEGDFVPLEEVETKMKREPLQLAALKETAPQTKHRFTGEDMIWMPKLSMKDEQAIRSTQERKRTLSSEQKVKATPATKVAKVETVKAEEGGPSMAPVPEAQIRKLSKVAEDMEATLVQVACHFWAQSDLHPMGRMKV